MSAIRKEILNGMCRTTIAMRLPPLHQQATNVGAYCGILCSLQNNKDVYGDVVASVEGVATAQGCCGVCAKNDLCGTFAWNSYNGGTCWMKAKSDGTVDSANTVGFTR